LTSRNTIWTSGFCIAFVSLNAVSKTCNWTLRKLVICVFYKFLSHLRVHHTPSKCNFKEMVRGYLIANCPMTTDADTIACAIFGPDIVSVR
jgi:hypothetical protein